MSTVKQRSKGVDKSTPLAQAADDVAKNKSSKESRAAPSSSCSSAACILFYVTLTAGAAFLAYCVHHLLEEVTALRSRQEAITRQKESIDQAMESALKQVHSLQTTVGSFQSVLKEVEQKQEDSERATREGGKEMRQIGDVLKKLQDEILKDLSNGIQDVKDARERDFPFFEKNIEEKLTELTTSINDNIALFTAVQKRSENEINNMKAKVAALEITDLLTSELKVLQDNISELQTTLEVKDKAMELLKNAVGSADSILSDNIKELSQLKQAHEIFKETVEDQQDMLKTLIDQVQSTQESTVNLPSDVSSLREEFLQIQSSLREQKQHFSKNTALMEIIETNSKSFGSRLELIEESVSEINSILSDYKDLDSRFAATQDSIDMIRSLVTNSDTSIQAETDSVQSLRESQESFTNELEGLRRSINALPNMTVEFHKVMEEVNKAFDLQMQQLHKLHSEQLGPLEANLNLFHTFPDKMASLEGFVSELQSAVGEVQSDLSMLRTAVDNLITYSIKIETNENKLEAMRGSLDDLRYEHDRLLEKIEKVQEAM